MKNLSGAFAVARDAIALAVFAGQRLECWKVRSLPNSHEKAAASAAAFARWSGLTFNLETAWLADGSARTKRKDALDTEIENSLRQQGIPILRVAPDQLFRAFRQPALTRRGDFRRIVSIIFPQLQGYRSDLPLLDAAALGLYCETERLLAINT